MNKAILSIRHRLKEVYPPEALQGIARRIIEHVCHIPVLQQLCGKDISITDPERGQVERIVDRLALHEPLQYVLGETEFYGLPLSVTPDVLIPRPETEELVHLIVANAANHRPGQRMLDIATGSGCIAIALACQAFKADVYAIDVSPRALAVARRNAQRNKAEVTFIEADLLTDNWCEKLPAPFDVIVSNPPYVRRSERASMASNVLDYEPHLALFVPDDDPLRFYRRILDACPALLRRGGQIYFEINSAYGNEISLLMHERNWHNIQIKQDIDGKDRFVTATK